MIRNERSKSHAQARRIQSRLEFHNAHRHFSCATPPSRASENTRVRACIWVVEMLEPRDEQREQTAPNEFVLDNGGTAVVHKADKIHHTKSRLSPPYSASKGRNSVSTAEVNNITDPQIMSWKTLGHSHVVHMRTSRSIYALSICASTSDRAQHDAILLWPKD